jgi:hypothetical protein
VEVMFVTLQDLLATHTIVTVGEVASRKTRVAIDGSRTAAGDGATITRVTIMIGATQAGGIATVEGTAVQTVVGADPW